MAKSKRSKNIVRSIIVAVLLIGCVHLAGKLQAGPDSSLPAASNASTSYGDLLDVKTKPGTAEVLKRYKAMDLSFNPDCHIPNWVAWELTADETTGEVSRTNKFSSDPDVRGCADTWDYSYSGYDRGHMAPAGDMKWSADAMAETFLLTNICPQAKSLNAGSWKGLEEKCRQWAQAGECHLYCMWPCYRRRTY